MKIFLMLTLLAQVAVRNSSADDASSSSSQTNTPMMTTTQKPALITERYNWELSKRGETPYLALLYGKNFFNNSCNHTSVFHPGGACGGVLLTRNRILTLCACVRTYYAFYMSGYLRQKDNNESYDIQAEDIMVQFPTSLFGPNDDTYSLGKDPAEFMTDTVCTNDILYGQGKEFLQASMIVMPLSPEIQNLKWEQLPLWPPYKIHGYFGLKGNNAALVALGVKPKNSSWDFLDDSGGKLNFSVKAVDIFLIRQSNWTNHCNIELIKTSGTQISIPLPVLERSTCFRTRDKNFQLCGGVIAFPIVTPDHQLAGMSGSEMDCAADGSSLVGTVFDDVTIYEIQKFVGVENLHLSTTGIPRTAPFTEFRGCEMSVFRPEFPNALRLFSIWSSLKYLYSFLCLLLTITRISKKKKN